VKRIAAWIGLGALGLGALACRSTAPGPPRSARWVPAAIVDWPIPFGRERRQLTLDYIRNHYDPSAERLGIRPLVIVLHWSETPTLAALHATFEPDTIAAERPEILRAGRVNVSSHFGVDRDGTIYRFLPPTVMARHVIGLNRSAIGVENVGGSALPLTDAQERADADLVRWLAGRYPTIRYLIGHFESAAFRGTALWEELDPGYLTEKEDPGPEFMARVRARVADLHLLDRYAAEAPRR